MKTRRSRKALSPVVASIILIAVTVAVSIAVAAWMGALSFSFMGSGEQLNVGTPYAWDNTAKTVKVDVNCPGGSAVTIASVRLNGTQVSYAPLSVVIPPTNTTTLTITNTADWQSGYYYQIVVVTSKNHEFQTTGMAP